jgi:hypothetical protein
MQYNKINTMKVASPKRILTMDAVEKYIDLCLIDEYADKDFKNGYTLDIDSLPDSERANFLDKLMKEDTNIRDFVLYHMQKIINDRLKEKEAMDRFDAGITLTRTFNGDYYLSKQA